MPIYGLGDIPHVDDKIAEAILDDALQKPLGLGESGSNIAYAVSDLLRQGRQVADRHVVGAVRRLEYHDPWDAGKLAERAGNFALAMDVYERARNYSYAARAAERAGYTRKAVRFYRMAGMTDEVERLVADFNLNDTTEDVLPRISL